MTTVKQFYDYLVRTSHPVYKKDFGIPDKDSPFHLIRNYIVAIQLHKLNLKVEQLRKNSFPIEADVDGLKRYEQDYFGFTKDGYSTELRRDELLKWINSEIGMSVTDVINLAVSITGEEPRVILNVSQGSWTLGVAYLGVDTILAGYDTLENRYTYLVEFGDGVSSEMLQRIEKELTRLEKAGSSHILYSSGA